MILGMGNGIKLLVLRLNNMLQSSLMLLLQVLQCNSAEITQ